MPAKARIRSASEIAAIRAAIDAAGGPTGLGRKVGATRQTVNGWWRDGLPSERVKAVAKASGVLGKRLRPDLPLR